MNTAALFSQLKTFCFSVQHDCDKMKRSLSKQGANVDANGDDFLKEMESQLERLQREMLAIETHALGPIESRLSAVSIEEFNVRLSNLFEANFALLQLVQQHTSSVHAVDGSNPIKLFPGKSAPSNFDTENQENIATNESCQPHTKLFAIGDRAILGDITAATATSLSPSALDEDGFEVSMEDEYEEEASGSQSPNTSYFNGNASVLEASPLATNDGTGNLVSAKTPTLADWKLSEVTKSLVQPHRDHYHHNTQPKQLYAASPVMDIVASSGYTNSSNGAGRIDDLKFTATPPAVRTVASFTTTAPVAAGTTNSNSSTPATPEIGTPLNTCTLRHANVGHLGHQNRPNDTKMLLASPPAFVSGSGSSSCVSSTPSSDSMAPSDMAMSVERPAANARMINNYVDSSMGENESYQDSPTNTNAVDFDVDNDIDISISPLKVAKLLQPRAFATDRQAGWIPQVTAAEWASSPSFLQKQVTLEMLNAALDVLNAHIATSAAGEQGNASKRGDTAAYAQEALYALLEAQVGTAGLKPVVMAIVYHKRLDISMEGDAKFYKVKRYY